MSARIVLKCEEGSSIFSERVLTLPHSGQAIVTRASGEEHPADDNAVFDCKVLSRAQAVFSFVNGKVYLKDNGSRNGSFINGSRLSKPLHSSDETCVYSEDVIRFGNSVRDQSKVLIENCVLAKLMVILPCGAELGTRPIEERNGHVSSQETFAKEESYPRSEIMESCSEEIMKEKIGKLEKKLSIKYLKESINTLKVRDDENLIEIDKLKKTLESKEEETNKLKEELANKDILKDNINSLKRIKEENVKEISQLKNKLELKEEEANKLAEELSKEEIKKKNVEELQNKLDERENILEKITADNAQLRKDISIADETIEKKDTEINKLVCSISDMKNEINLGKTEQDVKCTKLETEIKKDQEAISCQNTELQTLNCSLAEAKKALNEKETEIIRLTLLVDEEETAIKDKDGAYQELESIISEEDETLQQVENEMKRLLDIIAEDQETILTKDKSILALQNLIQEKDDLRRTESRKNSQEENEKKLNVVISKIRKVSVLATDEIESKLCNITIELNELKGLALEKDLEIQNLESKLENQMEVTKTHEELKIKCDDLMNIIMIQNDKLKKDKVDNQNSVVSRAGNLGEEVLKAEIEQKNLDIRRLDDLLQQKEEIFNENNTKNEQYIHELDLWQKTVQNAEEIVKASTFLKDNEEMIKTLQLKIVNEQEINEQAEEEIIQLRIELDNMKNDIEKGKESKDEDTDKV